MHLNASSGILFASFCILMPVFLQLIHTSANNASLDHGRNLNFWDGQSPGGGQMRFVGDFLALKVNATNARNPFIHYKPANFIK